MRMRSISLALALATGLALPALAQGKTAPDASAQKSAAGANPVVVIDTSLGAIEVELYADKAPLTVQNFLAYVDAGFYDGTIFHRVIDNFMIQGGGYTADLKRKEPRPPVKNEAHNGLRNTRGTIAMARTAVVDSATAQFFINVVDNPALNHRDKSPSGYGYAVFGEVKSGMDVVDKIKVVKTGSCGFEAPRDCPTTPVVIKSVKRKATGADKGAPKTTPEKAAAPAGN